MTTLAARRRRYARRTLSRIARYGARCRAHRVCRDIRPLVLVPGATCVWCGALADTLEHLLPLRLGGRHCVYRNTILPACRSCNSSRGSLTIEEWFAPSLDQ